MALFLDDNETSNTQGFSQVQMLTNPYSVSGNMQSLYRMVLPIDVVDATWRVPFSQAPGHFQVALLITGAPASTNLGQLTVNYSYDCIPAAQSQQMAALDFPKLGPFTPEALAMLYVTFTGFQALDYRTAAKLAASLKALPSHHYDDIYSHIVAFLGSYVPRANTLAPQPGDGDLDLSSFSLA